MLIIGKQQAGQGAERKFSFKWSSSPREKTAKFIQTSSPVTIIDRRQLGLHSASRSAWNPSVQELGTPRAVLASGKEELCEEHFGLHRRIIFPRARSHSAIELWCRMMDSD
jgi:hypothetical protein